MDGRKLSLNRFDGRFSAQSAARAGEDVTGELFKVDGNFGSEQDVQNVLLFVTAAVLDTKNILPAMNNPFSKKKTGGQLGVVAGRAHGHADSAAANADLQRFFLGQLIVDLPKTFTVPAKNLHDRAFLRGSYSRCRPRHARPRRWWRPKADWPGMRPAEPLRRAWQSAATASWALRFGKNPSPRQRWGHSLI